ncbi:ABC transporter ATP-binding protein [Taylorella equigenitalis]|uniref:ABC transporter ATP-binding protein n=1 Tax=Taylorella equigenitalis TaxID=29575 RepID=UPI00237CC580|nr:ABC transporter ATP-binding protein [Taylorella equigenitalis]WDU55570.1 ABC transporter ATP-binding protein [Taylorella equigenitalis]
MCNLLEIRDLSTSYGKVNALNIIELGLDEGQVVSVIGANGAGKSTLLNTIMGLLPNNGRSEGRIIYKREDISQDKIEHRMLAGISLVPEKRELFASMEVEDNLLLGGFRRFLKRDPELKRSLERIYELFPRLKERRKQLAGTLSGGERQMLAVGRALMSNPTLLMLDEPSLGLAPLVVREVFEIIKRLKSMGVSILLVEQNARSALKVSDYAYVLEMGEVSHRGPSNELLNDPKVIESYLGFGKRD